MIKRDIKKENEMIKKCAEEMHDIAYDNKSMYCNFQKYFLREACFDAINTLTPAFDEYSEYVCSIECADHDDGVKNYTKRRNRIMWKLIKALRNEFNY